MIIVRILFIINGSIIGTSLLNNTVKNLQPCQRLLTYEEIYELLIHSPCTSPLRLKRDDNTASTSNVYALQSTINDHRTIIDDHRKMINYLINNTINITQLNEYYTEQHMKRTPIWSSWRDLSILLLLFICVCVIIGLLAKRFHPLDILTSILVHRQQNKQKQPQQLQEKSRKRDMIKASIPISSIEREYMRYERDSNASL